MFTHRVRTERFSLPQVSSNLAPAALGAEVLSVMSAVQASVVAFGSNLCSRLAGHINIQGAFYALLATLVAAVYYDHSTIWYCAAFALLTGAPPLLLPTPRMHAHSTYPAVLSGCAMRCRRASTAYRGSGTQTELS